MSKNTSKTAAEHTTKKLAVKTEWDFSLLYKNENDPKIEQDVQLIEKAFASFAKKYANKEDYLSDEHKLAATIKDWEKVVETVGSTAPMFYLINRQSVESQNSALGAKVGLLQPRLTKASNLVLFFDLKLGKIPTAQQKKFLSSDVLKDYRYMLKSIFEHAKYNLSEAEEKIMNLKSQPANDLWVDAFSRILSAQNVTFKGKTMPLPEASNLIPQLPTKDRRALQDLTNETLKQISEFARAEINAIYTNKKIDDELRGFAEPYTATIKGYQNDEKAILSLVDAVTKGFTISKRFYKLKAQLLKLDHLEYADRNVGVGKNQTKINLDQAIKIITEGFGRAGSNYVRIFNSMLENGQVDVYPKKGKQGGAYCWGGDGVPTLVMLNYVPSADAVMTFAHEMGHAIHTELSKIPRPIYTNYTISVAEVASTFFENLAFEELLKTMSDKEKIIALHDRIQDFISTIFRQIACFNFELDLHRQIRTQGSLSKEEIAHIHNKHMQSYTGPVMKFKELDGYFFAQWGHIRRFFYVYSYAYGALISRALYKKYQEDPKNIEKVNAFMEAGATMSPEDIFKSVGIDTTKPEFFEAGLKSIEDDIKLLETLAKKNKLI